VFGHDSILKLVRGEIYPAAKSKKISEKVPFAICAFFAVKDWRF